MIFSTVAGRVGNTELGSIGESTALKFSVGANYYDRKAREQKTQWVNCTLFGKRAESLPVEKGQYVTVTGELRVYEGSKGPGLSLNVSEVSLGPKSNSGAPTASARQGSNQSARSAPRSNDIPFDFNDGPF